MDLLSGITVTHAGKFENDDALKAIEGEIKAESRKPSVANQRSALKPKVKRW